MIDKVFWHENVTLFVDALNEIEQDGPDCKSQEESGVNRAVRELLNALDDAATLRLEARAAAVHAYRDGMIDERTYQTIIGAANL